MLVAVLKEVVVGLEGEVELPDEVGQHQEDHGEAEVLADAAAPASLKLQRSLILILYTVGHPLSRDVMRCFLLEAMATDRGQHSSSSISPTAGETCQKYSTKYHD